AYVLQDIPEGAKIRIEAQAVNLETVLLQALADIPSDAGGGKAPVRNITTSTTAAVLLANELGDETLADIPSTSLQNSAALQPNLDEVASAIDLKLGVKVIRRLQDILAELQSLLNEVRELIKLQKELLQKQQDLLQDRSYNGIDPNSWSRPTTQVGNFPALPDGTCPKPPPRPDGTFPTPPTPVNGQCPPPPHLQMGGQQPTGPSSTQPVQPPQSGTPTSTPTQTSPSSGTWPTTGPHALADGSCPVPRLPPGAPPIPTPTALPNQYCPPPEWLGIPPPPGG
ncbi:MAG TPA: hypothetical protein V6D23_27445, partial [Candidatus Obscuribacterales bacterium]